MWPNLSWGLAGNKREVSAADKVEAVTQINGATGVLIGPNIVLAAGHVVKFGFAKLDEVEIRFTESSNPNKKFKIKAWKAAERGMFPTRYLDHSGQDLAVIMLEEDVAEALSIKPYKESGAKLSGRSVMLVGYGSTEFDAEGRCSGSSSSKLMTATSKVKELLKEEGCWGAPLILQSPDVTPCIGDSGGPALIFENGETFVVGIASGPYNSVFGGSHLGRAFQYADVGSANAWITSAIKELKESTSSSVSELDCSGLSSGPSTRRLRKIPLGKVE